MRKPSNYRLTEEGLALLEKMAAASGISRTAMLEIAIREAARLRGLLPEGRTGARDNPPQG